MYIALFIALVVVMSLVALFTRAKHERKKQQKIAESYVSLIFSTQSYRPEVVASFTYGTPSFSLKFNTDEDKQHAFSSGLTEQYLKKIQELCGHLCPHGETFDAEKAVAIYSVEDEKRWAKEAAKFRNENN